MEKYPNINILINVPEKYIPKAEFVLRTYCYILRLNPKFFYSQHNEGIHLYYGPYKDRNYPIRIHYDEATADFFEAQELYPLEKVNFRKYNKEHIPFLFSQSGEIYSFSDDFCAVRKDIVASGFYFLTCWHEYILSIRGVPKGRFDYRQSLQFRWDFTDVPVVDVYCQVLYRSIKLMLPQYIRDIHWPGRKTFAVSLSHDIDYWHYWTQQQMLNTYYHNLVTLYKRPLSALFKMLGHTLHKIPGNNPYRKIRKIVRREDKLGVQATWFLLAKDTYEDMRQNYIGDDVYRKQIKKLLGNKDIGLHGSPESAFDSVILEGEINKLEELGLKPSGFRTHYLHFDYQKSFSILEKAGIKYDSTLGYWEHVGYRAGISFPFYPFNLKENRPFRVLEIPLIVMDTTLLSHKAMSISFISAYHLLTSMMKKSSEYRSHLSLLWHNTTFDVIDYPFWGRLYWKMIKKARKCNAWVTSLNRIYEEWVNIS